MRLPCQESEVTTGDEAIINSMKGAGIGGLFGALIGSPLLLATGLGAAVIAGPVAAAATGIMVGGFLGGLSGWGVHRDHVQDYEEKVQSGKVLVVVSGKPDRVAEAEKIFNELKASDVRMHARTSEDSPEIDDRP